MRHVLRILIATAALLIQGSAAMAADPGTLIGEWVLVEQTYGSGSSNLIRPGDPTGPVRLRFEREGAAIVGSLRAGADTARSWPRLVADASRALRIENQRFSERDTRVEVRYRVDPSPGDDLILEVTERYRVIEDGRALVGTVDVAFRRDGADRGSYVLHRRYERLP